MAYDDIPRGTGEMVLIFKSTASFTARAEGIPWSIEFVNKDGGTAAGPVGLGIMSQAVNQIDGPRFDEVHLPATNFDVVAHLRLIIVSSGKFVH
jgi:hypothetical protein